MALEISGRLEGIPLTYVVGLIIMLATAAAATTIAVDRISGNAYSSAYFTLSALFDAVGIDANSGVLASAPLFSSGFDVLFPLLMLDGVIKIAVLGFLIAGVVELITNVNIRARLISMRIRKLRGSVIVCGYNMLAEELCQRMSARSMPFIVIEKDKTKSEMLMEKGYNVVNGDFTSDATLRESAVGRARAMIFTTESDFDNMLGIVTAHHANGALKILSRAREDQAVSKMHRAGASLCFVPEVLTGLELGNKLIERVGHG